MDTSPDAGSDATSQGTPDAAGGQTGLTLAPDEIRGSRLVPTFTEQRGSDGSMARSLDGWFDLERNELCEVTTLADGALHCAPHAAYATEAFRDAACGSPVLVFMSYGPTCLGQQSVSKYEYMWLPSGQACHGPRLAAYPEGAPLALSTMYARDAQGACVERPLQNDRSYEFYARPAEIAEIPPAAFVAVTERVVQRGEGRVRLEEVHRAGADGSAWVRSEYSGLVDTARNEKCSIEKDDLGVSRCVPGSTSLERGTLYFTTAACSAESSVRVARSNVPSSCTQADPRATHQRYFLDRVDACHSTLYARPSSAPYTGQLYYSYSQVCNSASMSPGMMAWPASAFTTAIESTVFAEAKHGYVREADTFYGTRGGVLMPARWVSTSEGLTAGSGGRVLANTASEEACMMTVLEDGKTYCVGAAEYARGGAGDGNQYADPGCTEPSVYVDRPIDCATGRSPELANVLVQQVDMQSSCRTARLFHRPVEEVGGPGYVRDGGGACVALQPAPAERPRARYRQKDLVPIDPTTLVEITTTSHVR